MSTYELCKQLAARSKLTVEKLDVFYAADHLTKAQYEELLAMIQPKS